MISQPDFYKNIAIQKYLCSFGEDLKIGIIN